MFSYPLATSTELRILQSSDAGEFADFVQRDRAYLTRYLNWATTIKSCEDAAAFLQRGVKSFADDGLPWVGIWQNDCLVGGVLFTAFDPRIQSADIGYWLDSRAAGRGLATLAVSAMVGFAFRRRSLNRLVAQMELGNERSEALAQRLGFKLEGTRRAAWKNGDHIVDLKSYSLLAREWAAG